MNSTSNGRAVSDTEGLPTFRELALLWFALQRLANREQENGTLVFCVR
jgi:hypothetical protein